ncbi:MAG TPA: thiamine pyrophosphate-dependent dehydrogenase E1 component subunit alpha [Candidatus Krumholzibacteria bacterium]
MKPSTSEEYTLTIPEGLALDRTSHLELYYFMSLNRKLEERLSNLYRQNKVVGGLYSSLGQEGCSVGSAYALERGDFFAPMIRNLGGMLVRGVDPVHVMGQYCARAIGPTGGKDLNVHFGWIDRGIVSPISMLASLVPVFAGIALEMKMHGKKNVALTYVGDGATSTTDFHEGMNFAAVHRLPLIIIVENNGYAYSTPTSMQFNVPDFVVRAQGYGCYGEMFDGNNVMAALDVTRRARARCVAGEGPVLLEAKTFRRKGHAEHDDAGYVPPELRAYWEKRDPLDAYRRFLDLHRIVESAQEIDEIDGKINQLLDAAVDEALASPFPDPSTLMENVYGN